MMLSVVLFLTKVLYATGFWQMRSICRQNAEALMIIKFAIWALVTQAAGDLLNLMPGR